MSSQFLEANFNGGLQSPHYFNGRLLSAEDLQASQMAVLARQNWLGQANGYGVIEGLMVTQIGEISVQITAGLALNQQGQVVRLPSDIILPLLSQTTRREPVNDGTSFMPCNIACRGSTQASPAGCYLLTALPVSHLESQTPMNSAPGNVISSIANTARCGSCWEVEGIQFKIICLTDFDTKTDGVSENQRRNLLAHWCYGSSVLPDLALDPFHFPANFGGLDLLEPAELTPCDLPLAVFHWTGSRLTFVDAWSARRRLIRPDAVVETNETMQPHSSGSQADDRRDIPSPLRSASFLRTWKGLLSDKRVAVAQARFLQFQHQIQQLVDDGKAQTVVAVDYFRFLPPVSFLPVTSDSTLWASTPQTSQFYSYLQSLLKQRDALAQDPKQQGSGHLVNAGTYGFNLSTFLSKLPRSHGDIQNLRFHINMAVVHSEIVDFTLQQSWYDEAIDLSHVEDSFPYFNLYFVAENVVSPYDQLYVMLVKAQRPFVWAIPPQSEQKVGG
jgi:hypothetical protein